MFRKKEMGNRTHWPWTMELKRIRTVLIADDEPAHRREPFYRIFFCLSFVIFIIPMEQMEKNCISMTVSNPNIISSPCAAILNRLIKFDTENTRTTHLTGWTRFILIRNIKMGSIFEFTLLFFIELNIVRSLDRFHWNVILNYLVLLCSMCIPIRSDKSQCPYRFWCQTVSLMNVILCCSVHGYRIRVFQTIHIGQSYRPQHTMWCYC